MVRSAAKNLHNSFVLSLKRATKRVEEKAPVTLTMSESGARTFSGGFWLKANGISNCWPCHPRKGLKVSTKGKCPVSRVTRISDQARAVAARAESRIVRAFQNFFVCSEVTSAAYSDQAVASGKLNPIIASQKSSRRNSICFWSKDRRLPKGSICIP